MAMSPPEGEGAPGEEAPPSGAAAPSDAQEAGPSSGPAGGGASSGQDAVLTGGCALEGPGLF